MKKLSKILVIILASIGLILLVVEPEDSLIATNQSQYWGYFIVSKVLAVVCFFLASYIGSRVFIKK